MSNKLCWKTALILSSLACLLIMTACGSASPAAPSAAPVSDTAPAASAPTATATVEPTATPAPSNTPEPTLTATLPPPTETPAPTATVTPDPNALPVGISGWCLPDEVMVSAASDPMKPPEAALIGTMVENGLEIRNQPFSVCVFRYTFEQAAPQGLTLEIYDINQKTPWWKAELTPVEGHPNTVYTQLRHTYIIDPPLWEVHFEFAVRDSGGAELQRDVVNLYKWETGICWQGNKPDPVTLYCPLQQDLHPWDLGYGTALPTVTPDGD